MNRKVIDVAVGIIMRDGQVLCCQRRRDSRYSLQWEFPGGKMRDNELPADCLKRELKEELGITIVSYQPYETRIQNYPENGTFKVNYFLINDFTGDVENNVFEAVRWIPLQVLNTLNFLAENQPVIDRLKMEYLDIR